MIFLFKIRVWEDEELQDRQGFACGKSYSDMVKNLEDYYGATLEEISWLTQVGNDKVYELSNEGMDEFLKIKDNFIW